MTIDAIKSQIQDMVWDSEDETALEKVLAVAHDILGKPEPDILDDLSPSDLAKLNLALEQARRGEGILWSDYKKKLDLWLAERR